MTPTSLANHESDVLSLLNAAQVEYLVIADLDVWVATQKRNAQKLVAVFHAFGHGLRANDYDDLMKRQK